jgi:hypothetical protein
LDSAALILVGLLAAMLALGAVYGLITSSTRRRKEGGSLSAIDFARGSFATQLSHGVPMADLLLQMVEAMRDSFKLDAAELWLNEGGLLRLTASEPKRERAPIPITPAEESIAVNARVSGAAWAKVWLPDLLRDRAETYLRVAPVSHSAQLFGLIVAERSRRGENLAGEADETLEEVAREVGVAVNKARLDSALQESLDRLRKQAAELQASRGRLVAVADAERRRIERPVSQAAPGRAARRTRPRASQVVDGSAPGGRQIGHRGASFVGAWHLPSTALELGPWRGHGRRLPQGSPRRERRS